MVHTESRCGLYLDHVKNVICAGDEEKYARLITWMREALVSPGKSGVAVVLQGPAGCGMGTFINNFGSLFIGTSVHTHARQLCGSFFRSLVQDCLLLNIEVCGSMDKLEESVVKSLITEQNILIEKKGEEAEFFPNNLNLILSTNDKFVVPSTMDDRRFFIFDVADTHVGSSGTYFAAIEKQMDLQGCLALQKMLLTQ